MNDEQERDAEVAAAERTRSDQIVNAVLRARDDLLKVWHAARRVDGRDIDTPLTEAIHAVCNALFYAAEMPTIVHKDGENEEIGRHILRIKALEYHLRAEKAETERDAVIERWGAMVDIAPDYLRGQEPATAMRGLIAERNAARAEVKRLRNAVWSAYSDLHAHLYVATNMEGGRLFSAYETLRANYTAIRAALGIESEAGE